jgi:uncharacterized coiled-coil protein SlyX
VGGSGWAGVYGSFIGLAKSATSSKKGKKPKIKKISPSFSGHLTMQEARHAGLTRQQWQKQASQHVARIEKDIVATRQKLVSLVDELKKAERARQAAYEVKTSPDKPAVDVLGEQSPE